MHFAACFRRGSELHYFIIHTATFPWISQTRRRSHGCIWGGDFLYKDQKWKTPITASLVMSFLWKWLNLFCSTSLHLNLEILLQFKIAVFYCNTFLNEMYLCGQSWIFSIITPVFSVTWSSEIILICWFTAQETVLIFIILLIFFVEILIWFSHVKS